jgi:hypothetical protein
MKASEDKSIRKIVQEALAHSYGTQRQFEVPGLFGWKVELYTSNDDTPNHWEIFDDKDKMVGTIQEDGYLTDLISGKDESKRFDFYDDPAQAARYLYMIRVSGGKMKKKEDPMDSVTPEELAAAEEDYNMPAEDDEEEFF